MSELRRLVDSGTPVIYAGGWDRFVREGWRFAENLSVIASYTNKQTIKDYITTHGPVNVALGQYFDRDLLKPQPNAQWCGLYVRDVDILVGQMLNALDDTEAVGRWLADDEKGTHG